MSCLKKSIAGPHILMDMRTGALTDKEHFTCPR